MEAKDLRIGNYIDYTTEREIVTMQTTYEYLRLIHNGNKNFKPIQLTEEWLLKFGFKYNKLQFCSNTIIVHQYKIKGICLSIDERKVNKHEYSFFGNNFIRTVKHVHQLQNLYFALTGEELKLK